ncbi:hypothetical protein ACIRG5_41735 [Lentzea sp. NPDC102401]|uniref:hypothetical protein n=1 Tax=Lentzea sp. NPDC102401 TaxID=3364128 RepID=UPI00381793EB
MLQAGVPIMTGTDGPGTNPADLHTEFRELAACLGRVDRMDAIAPGVDADVLLLATATV